MKDKDNLDVRDDITFFTEKYFKEIEGLLKKLEKDEFLQKTDLTKDWVDALLNETFDEEDPPIYARLIKKYGRLVELRKDQYVLSAEANFPDGKFKPYVELYLKVSENHILRMIGIDFIITLYKELKSPEFKEIVIQQRKYDHTKKTRNEKHIKDLFNYQRKLLVIRIALRYKEGYLLPEYKCDVRNNGKYNQYLRQKAEEVKDDLKSLINLLKILYKNDLTGYMWKLRYDPQNQFYYQLMIFLDGDKHTKDVTIAKKICGLWKDTVTRGNGKCTNFNAYKKQHTNLGLGIRYRDERELVIEEAKIFIEHDYFVNSMLSGKTQRTFSKNHIPGKTRSGRPSILQKTIGTYYQ
jgi:hypothetical protein